MPTATGIELPAVAQEVDVLLRQGSPAHGWRGDPNLSLGIGVVKTNRAGVDSKTKRYQRKGDVIGWQWQVWRHCETGKDEIILQLKGEELYTIFDRIIKIDPRTPGFEPTMDTVEREGRKVELEKENAIKEAQAEQAEHLWALVADRQNGRTTFRGMPGRNPDKQM